MQMVFSIRPSMVDSNRQIRESLSSRGLLLSQRGLEKRPGL